MQLPQPARKDMSVAWGEPSSEPAAPSRAVPAMFNTTSKWLNTSRPLSASQGQGNFKFYGHEPSTPSSSMSSYSQQCSSSSQSSMSSRSSKSMFGALEETVKVSAI